MSVSSRVVLSVGVLMLLALGSSGISTLDCSPAAGTSTTNFPTSALSPRPVYLRWSWKSYELERFFERYLSLDVHLREEEDRKALDAALNESDLQHRSELQPAEQPQQALGSARRDRDTFCGLDSIQGSNRKRPRSWRPKAVSTSLRNRSLTPKHNHKDHIALAREAVLASIGSKGETEPGDGRSGGIGFRGCRRCFPGVKRGHCVT